MHALRIDYQRDNRPVPWLGVLLLLAALAVLALLGGHTLTLNRQIDVWEKQVQRIEQLSSHRARASRPLTEQEARAQVLEVKQANQVMRQLGLPWNALFRAVESSGGKNIALLSMEPDMQKGTVKLSGEAKDIDALLDYVRQLSKREVFSSVFLLNHQIRQDDPEKPLHFAVLAYWQGESP
jgi:Tfp pilus assembly protein PilN